MDHVHFHPTILLLLSLLVNQTTSHGSGNVATNIAARTNAHSVTNAHPESGGYRSHSSQVELKDYIFKVSNYWEHDYLSYNYANSRGHYNPSEPITTEEGLIPLLLRRGRLTVRPHGGNASNGPVEVKISYNVVQILTFSQVEETMSISGWFTIQWSDNRLIWDPEKYGNITEVNLDSSQIWIPDVGVINGKSSSDFDFSTNVRARILVNSKGELTWLHGAVLDTTCPLDVAFFPFDYQTCFMIMTPWQSGVDQLKLVPLSRGPTVDNSYLPNSNVSEWAIQSVHFVSKVYRSDLNITYQYISIGFHLKRQPLYFVVLVLVPFAMLSVLACLIFTIDDTGDRLSVALSLVLSMTMYVVIVSNNAPRSMRTLPVIGIFLLDQLGLLSIATVLAVFNNKLHQSTSLTTWQDWFFALSGSVDFKSPPSGLNNSSYPSPPCHACNRNGYEGSATANHSGQIWSNFKASPPYSTSPVKSCNDGVIGNGPVFKNHVERIPQRHSKQVIGWDPSQLDSHGHHPKCNDALNWIEQRRVKSPWVEPLTNSNSYNTMQRNSLDASDLLEDTDRFSDIIQEEEEEDAHYSSPSRFLHDAVRVGATAAALTTSRILMQQNNVKTNTNHINNGNDSMDPGYNRNEEANLTKCLNSAALLSAFEAVNMKFKSLRLGRRKRSRRSQNNYLCQKCAYASNYPTSSFREDQMSADDCQSYESVVYPYKKLASRLDCIQMISYLLLSTINAIVCLMIMPRYSQDIFPPAKWIR